MYGCFSTQIAFRRLSVPLGNMGAQNEHMKAERILRKLMDWVVRSVFFFNGREVCVNVCVRPGRSGGPLSFMKQYGFLKPQRCCHAVKNAIGPRAHPVGPPDF